MTIYAMKTVDAEFTDDELELLIGASLNNNRTEEDIVEDSWNEDIPVWRDLNPDEYCPFDYDDVF